MNYGSKDCSKPNLLLFQIFDFLIKFLKATNGAVDVKSLMDTWTLQMGYPVVTLKKEKGKCIASQKRFLTATNAKSKKDSPFEYDARIID